MSINTAHLKLILIMVGYRNMTRTENNGFDRIGVSAESIMGIINA